MHPRCVLGEIFLGGPGLVAAEDRAVAGGVLGRTDRREPFEERAEAVRLLAEIHESFEQKTLFQWGIARLSDDKIIGTTTLFNLSGKNRRAEIGYALNRRFWGNGFVNEALISLFDFAFAELSLHRVEADVDPQNAASIRVLERLGFQKEGFLRERWIVGGKFFDALFYGLLRSDWEKSGR